MTMIGPRNNQVPIMAFQESIDGTLGDFLANFIFKTRLNELRGDELSSDDLLSQSG